MQVAFCCRKIMLQWLQQMKCSYAKKNNEMDTALKCDEVSLLWRQKGNDKFRANFVEESYKCYSKSVLYAKHNGPMYPLALANRSASLLRMKRFKVRIVFWLLLYYSVFEKVS